MSTAKPKLATVKKILVRLFLIVRVPLFLVMFWLRGPIVGLCHMVSVPMLFCWLFSWYAFPEKPEMVWAFCVASFVTFALAWLYDFVLMAIAPHDVILMQ
ncbi:MAG: hypothetical protein LBS49_09115 [Candidatus Accumulibacter sp.]|jgi:hypothetical protein|nr:hypothetical protein [Accumulibacter sp.]